ncbi:MAG: CRTAC1 family protein [Verrucomicrobiales bacterium]|nr:CRTAC1 family protein [Verrucomicrobiales bacterium]
MRGLGSTLLVLLGGAIAHGQISPGTPTPATKARESEDDRLVRSIVTSEETQLVLTRRLEELVRAVEDLRLPSARSEAANLFAPQVATVDLGPAPDLKSTNSSPGPGFDAFSWPLASPSVSAAPVELWRSFLDSLAYVDHARFRVLDGVHPDGDLLRFDAELGFEGSVRARSGEWRDVSALIETRWERRQATDGTVGEWQVAAWNTRELRCLTSPRRFFTEVLDQVLRSPADPGLLRRSQHYEATVKYYREGMKKLPHPYFAPISVNQKEGVAVADVNGDGFDDLYITVRLGKNLLLINHGDGTFSEQAAAYHLDLPGHTTCALFADFDNDGDLDVMLGRSLLRATYLENRDGVYHQHPIPKFMPMAVISMAAADYNGDGLLDVYLCTYRPAAPAGSGTGGGYGMVAKEGDFDWPDEFFSPEQAREFRQRLAEHRQRVGASALDQLGPPNVLLVNRGGGKFEPAPENSTVGLWRNSLQATWCDYNLDGRPDLYIPNDWGMNVLFRNDGPAGFKDVTVEAGLTFYGFSMGASFGDYDNDGRDDLYVSNMSSDAGRRMTSKVPGLDRMLIESALGNWLYHGREDGRFVQVSGLRPPAVPVMKAGWSWGGCFGDFNNDTFLDLYVVNGYFTAPAELASGLDLESNLWRTMLRADAKLTRNSFRASPEWRRTPPPDRLGPQIDARLSGVERTGDRLLVHSLHGQERNRFFANHGGRQFVDASGISGLDNPADGRGFGILDMNRDGWLDLALVNANQPLFNLYRNDMASAGFAGGVIALRFRGANRTAEASTKKACRDGFGARVELDLGDQRIVREHRCGEGWSAQHSATMVVGIGVRNQVPAVTVRWPSGRSSTTRQVPEGTLLTVYEDPTEAAATEGWTRESYRIPPPAAPAVEVRKRPAFAVRSLDTAAKPSRLRLYTAFATSWPGSVELLGSMRQVQEELRRDGVDCVLVTLDPLDDDVRLGAFHRQWKPTWRLANIPVARRPEVSAAFAAVTARVPTGPVTVVTDDTGGMVAVEMGVPTVSSARRALEGIDRR